MRLAAPGPSILSSLMISASITASVVISLAMDAVLLIAASPPPEIVVSALMFNATVILQSVVGGIIEWKRPGHTIGRLLMLGGPLYALIATGWLTSEALRPFIDPEAWNAINWVVVMLSWPGVALVAGWIPLLFPSGTLPGPRWRLPVAVLLVVSTTGFVALALRPGRLTPEFDVGSPIAIEGWPSFLQVFVDAIPVCMLALLAMAVAGLVTRFRRGDPVERLQIRWFVAAAALCGIGFAATLAQWAVKVDGPLVMALVAYAGILAMPIAIGIAVTRYRLYELDRIISRTIGWAIVTGTLVAVFALLVVALQAALAPVTDESTLAVAASTLVAFALFQPLRRRVQQAVDRRFDRARYDGERTATAFAERLRDQIDLDALRSVLLGTVSEAVRPIDATLWLQSDGRADR